MVLALGPGLPVHNYIAEEMQHSICCTFFLKGRITDGGTHFPYKHSISIFYCYHHKYISIYLHVNIEVPILILVR